jgi:hypothetical protein
MRGETAQVALAIEVCVAGISAAVREACAASRTSGTMSYSRVRAFLGDIADTLGESNA